MNDVFIFGIEIFKIAFYQMNDNFVDIFELSILN